MQHELTSLERRISVLEDEELEIMEQLEEAQAAVTELEEKVAAHDERLAELRARAGELAAGLDAELATAAPRLPVTAIGASPRRRSARTRAARAPALWTIPTPASSASCG